MSNTISKENNNVNNENNNNNDNENNNNKATKTFSSNIIDVKDKCCIQTLREGAKALKRIENDTIRIIEMSKYIIDSTALNVAHRKNQLLP